MEQEKVSEEVSEVTDSRQVAREKFEIEGIGEFRAKPGTAVAELAGAASYWEKRAKSLEKAVWNARSLGKQDGFIAGLVASSVIFVIGYLLSLVHH